MEGITVCNEILICDGDYSSDQTLPFWARTDRQFFQKMAFYILRKLVLLHIDIPLHSQDLHSARDTGCVLRKHVAWFFKWRLKLLRTAISIFQFQTCLTNQFEKMLTRRGSNRLAWNFYTIRRMPNFKNPPIFGTNTQELLPKIGVIFSNSIS